MTLLERMARAYWLKRGGEWPTPTVMATNWTRDRMRELQAGRLPETDADRAALAVLREEQAPATPCATCGGTGEVTRGHQIVLTGRMWQEPCPDCRPDAGK